MKLAQMVLDARYDFWLDYHGVPRQQRRELRQELRANLAEATADRGWTAARAGLGSVRHLAQQNAEVLVGRQRLALTAGAIAALCTFAIVLLGVWWTMFAFADGVLATNLAPGESVTAPVTLLPGSSFTAEKGLDGGLGFGFHISPWWLVLPPLAAFVLASRPWRLLISADE